MKLLVIVTAVVFCSFESFGADLVSSVIDTPLLVHKCNDFAVTGKGDNTEWGKTKWTALNRINEGGKNYQSKFKIMYSATGIYVLFSGDDDKISTPFKNDFDSLFFADVFEVFFHPEISEPFYFEYEISPLDKELVLLIYNRKGGMGRGVPYHYDDKNKVIKNVSITGGKMESGAAIKSWTAELFFPYSVLSSLLNVPPKSGMRWNANFCRIDYDTGNQDLWSWSPVERSFHEFKKFYSLQFE